MSVIIDSPLRPSGTSPNLGEEIQSLLFAVISSEKS